MARAGVGLGLEYVGRARVRALAWNRCTLERLSLIYYPFRSVL